MRGESSLGLLPAHAVFQEYTIPKQGGHGCENGPDLCGVRARRARHTTTHQTRQKRNHLSNGIVRVGSGLQRSKPAPRALARAREGSCDTRACTHTPGRKHPKLKHPYRSLCGKHAMDRKSDHACCGVDDQSKMRMCGTVRYDFERHTTTKCAKCRWPIVQLGEL